jgi:hypothetical protein
MAQKTGASPAGRAGKAKVTREKSGTGVSPQEFLSLRKPKGDLIL